MKIRHALFFLAGINLLGALSAPQAGIAYFAHLGGGLFGYLYLKSEWLRRKLAYWHWPDIRGSYRANRARKTNRQKEDFQRQVDRILDKISRAGIDSLSDKERKILQLRSKRL